MLKQRDLAECEQLFDLMVHPDVFPFVRHKAFSPEEFLFLTKQTIEAEEQGHLISRTILDELFPNVYEQINQGEHRYQLLCIHKDHYHLHTMREPSIETYTEAMEA